MFDGIVMYSGGLDSTIVAHMLKSQGLRILAVHYVLPFYSGLGYGHRSIKKLAAKLDVPLQIVEEGDDFIEMMRDPVFGFGKNANPCIDCRIRRIIHARKIMADNGASFIATGEVSGQRPMSQGINIMNAIEKRIGERGILLRPLSAKLFPPTNAEIKGIVKRELLFDWSGRARTVQLDYAKKYGLEYQPPAGGCMLTNVGTARRFHEFFESTPDFTLNDFKMLAYGRHFRINSKCKFVIARNDSENQILAKILPPDNNYLQMKNSLGPVGLIRGAYTGAELELCASLLARFSKEKGNEEVVVELVENEVIIKSVAVKPGDDSLCDRLRI